MGLSRPFCLYLNVVCNRGEILRESCVHQLRSRRRHEVNEFKEKGGQHSVHLPVLERSRMMSGSGDIGEAYVNEVRHYPALAIVVIVIGSTALGLYSLVVGPEPLLILAIGAFLATIVALEGLRSSPDRGASCQCSWFRCDAFNCSNWGVFCGCLRSS